MGLAARALAAALSLLAASTAPAAAQRSGGTLRVYIFDSPASLSVHEDSTIVGVAPTMGLYNNLVMYDQSAGRAALDTVVPDLADSWAWSADGTRLTFKLRDGARWHDGKPFSAQDVACTFDLLLGRGTDKLRLNPRKSWYSNVEGVSVDDARTATLRLRRPQPALPALLASGFSPVYPCHVPAAQMRQAPVGTGPFKLAEYRRNEGVRVVRNPDYWKPGRPYLDGIEWRVIRSQATAILAFAAKSVDITSPRLLGAPAIKDVLAQAPDAQCPLLPSNVQRGVILNRAAPPFDNPDIRRAVALAIDRKAFLDILTQGTGDIGGAVLGPPAGFWGLPREMLETLPGYHPDVARNRAEARALMAKAGYGPDRRLRLKVSARDVAPYRDPAVVLIDQLKDIHIDAELEAVDTSVWYTKIARKDYAIGIHLSGNGVDDPDQAYFEGFACGSDANYDGYCDPGMDKLFEAQSREADPLARRRAVWEIERRLAEDVARPVLFHNGAATCWHPYVKGYVPMRNGIYNEYRMEDVWLDK